MTLYVSDKEMCERFVDSLKRSASRAEEFTKATPEDKPKLFVDFISGLKTAAGSAHQLAVSGREDPKWLDVRDLLEKIIEIGQSLPTFTGTDHLWIKIKSQLELLAVNGRKMFDARARNRGEVLSDLTARLTNLPESYDKPI